MDYLQYEVKHSLFFYHWFPFEPTVYFSAFSSLTAFVHSDAIKCMIVRTCTYVAVMWLCY